MKTLYKFIGCAVVLMCLSSVVWAQDDMPVDESVSVPAVAEETIPAAAEDAVQEDSAVTTDEMFDLEDEVIEELPPAMADMPVIKLRWLNKITARNKTIEVKVGETVKIGGLYMKPRACRKASPLEKPESAAFLQIWESGIDGAKPEWVFSGWMFASSPGLSSMDHPIYDVWVLECLEQTEEAAPDVLIDISDQAQEDGMQEIEQDTEQDIEQEIEADDKDEQQP